MKLIDQEIRQSRRPEPLHQFFIEEICSLYQCEKRWMGILPEVTRSLPAREANQVLTRHLEQTAARVIFLEEIFASLEQADRRESRRIEPLMTAASDVLTAVTRSTAAARGSRESPPCLEERSCAW